MKTILHVDMDAFYASVEQRDDPSLRGKPVIVGAARSRRGVVLAASYEVRAYGVRSAMSMAEALRRAPHALVVPPRRGAYEEAGARAFAIFRRYTPLVEPLSLDEAFIDVTESRALFGSGEAIAQSIRADVFREIGLPASAGVAPCKFAAKVASDLAKPNGQLVVPEGGVAAFLAPLPVERMWGVGPKTAPKMRALGYATLGDLAEADAAAIERAFGAWGPHARALANGDDPRRVDPHHANISIGTEQTYEADLATREAVARTLLDHASQVARRLVRANLCACTVAVKVKYADFTIRSRRVTLDYPVQDTDAIHEAALGLLARIPLEGRRVRLTGVSVSNIDGGPPPRTLLPDTKAEKRRKLEEVTSRIGQRFNDDHAVTRATLLEKLKTTPGLRRS